MNRLYLDGSGRTLYLLTADTGSKSTCYGTCASFWPADHTTGIVVGTDGNPVMTAPSSTTTQSPSPTGGSSGGGGGY